MATVSNWNPFDVALDITANPATVTRTSATTFTVKINASWETYYSGAKTNYGMTASSGGASVTLNPFGTKAESGSGTLTGTYSISGNGAATKTITVTFKNFNNDNGKSATKNVTFNVSVPAWTSYTVTFNANGGTGAPGKQTKWKDQTLTLSGTKPIRTGHTFLGWATSSTATSAAYSAGGSYTSNSSVTLYAVWKANTYTVSYNANGGTGAPGNQTKTYGKNLTLSSTKPTRTNYNFKGWGTSASATTVSYASGATYTANSAITLYAVWELAYKKPRIGNVSMVRCNSDGTPNDEGQNGLISFTWNCDRTISSITIGWKTTTSDSWTTVNVGSNDLTSGNVQQIVGNDSISSETTYDVRITVSDSNGSSYVTGTLASVKFAVDVKSGGKGIAFGKTAELEDVAEFGFEAKFNKPVYGKVLGMDKVPNIPAGADLNDYVEPGCYAINWNDEAAEILCGGVKLGSANNIPPAKAGRLEVWSSTGFGARSGYHTYLKQRFIPFGSEHPVWERDIDLGPDGDDIYYSWFRSTLTPTLSNRIYDRQNVLATTGMIFTAGHSITLSEPISKQMHGIVLVFSAYHDGVVRDYDFVSHYVPKELIRSLSSKGHTFTLMRTECYDVATKFLYIDDTRIWGDDRNQTNSTGSNITFKNNRFVLRYVYGV